MGLIGHLQMKKNVFWAVLGVIGLFVIIGQCKHRQMVKDLEPDNNILPHIPRTTTNSKMNSSAFDNYCTINSRSKNKNNINAELAYPCKWIKKEGDSEDEIADFYMKIDDGKGVVGVSFEGTKIGEVSKEFLDNLNKKSVVKDMFSDSYVTSDTIRKDGIKGIKVILKEVLDGDINKWSLAYNFFSNQHLLSITYYVFSKDKIYSIQLFEEYRNKFDAMLFKTKLN